MAWKRKGAYEYLTDENEGKIRKIDVIHRRDPDEKSCEGETKREKEEEREREKGRGEILEEIVLGTHRVSVLFGRIASTRRRDDTGRKIKASSSGQVTFPSF